ncbi:hypothetical protein [Paenarthrobacter sp. PH39-S1]|uniref:hypothetical protein n=1 Tax=Paenarthrobacter sp. PH39-S1 TaxID=3046204 RepID=UPI0024BA8CF4|nr:hypothetical protein [Paenarthrobacter sp. PH39-S1]MDJ0357019.1 hypothetical protein [Paenarthrobacter sp. PH39-S1]
MRIDECVPTDISSADYLQNLILDSKDVEDLLNGFAGFSARSLSFPECEVVCGVTLLRRKRARTVASSGQRALEMDEIQYSYDDGPCLSASRERITQPESAWPRIMCRRPPPHCG